MIEFSLNLLSSAYVHFMGFLFTCSPFILFLGIIIAFNIFFVRYLTKKERLTPEEPQNKDLWIKSKKPRWDSRLPPSLFHPFHYYCSFHSPANQRTMATEMQLSQSCLECLSPFFFHHSVRFTATIFFFTLLATKQHLSFYAFRSPP